MNNHSALKIHALEIAIASSSPGGGVSSNSPSFSSPNFCKHKIQEPILEKQANNEAELQKKVASSIS